MLAWVCASLLYSLLVTSVTSSAETGIYFACYNAVDNGTMFVGSQSMTEGGEKCSALDGENRIYCRNPDNTGSRPLCKTEDQGKVKQQACAIVSCHGYSINLKNVTPSASKPVVIGGHIHGSNLAKDGRLGTVLTDCFISSLKDMNAWWMADLGNEIIVNSVGFHVLKLQFSNRNIEQILVELSITKDNLFSPCGDPWNPKMSTDETAYRRCAPDSGIWARYVRIRSTFDSNSFSTLVLCEVQINSGIVPSQCRHRNLLSNQKSTFTKITKEEGLEIQCQNGYWPGLPQQLTCQDSGYWSEFSCKKVENLDLKQIIKNITLYPTVFQRGEKAAVAKIAIDGIKPTDPGKESFWYCASSTRSSHSRLQVLLSNKYNLISVKLYLLNYRREWQNGLKVIVSDEKGQDHQCGKIYNESQGQTPTFDCDKGVISSSLRLQRENNFWLQVCEIEVAAITECESPPVVNFSMRSFESVSINSNASYTCVPGYSPASPQRITCMTYGKWSSPLPACEPVSCDAPSARIGNAFATQSDKTKSQFGSVVQYNCDRGYENEGNNVQICSSNGQWQGKIVCKVLNCTSMPRLENGQIQKSGLEINFLCNAGYKLLNSHNAYCQKGNKWTYINGKPRCEAVSCGRPPSLLNGRYEGHVFRYGAIARYHCNVGYCLVGTNTSICLKEGYWNSNTHRKCQILKCPNLQSISNGSVSESSNNLGGMATYQCKTGFDLIGSHTRSCQESSSAHCTLIWTENPPTCRAKDCGDPGVISRGRIAVIQGDGRRYPSYIQFICNLGYQIVEGTEFMTCSSSQVWKGKRPKCQPVYCGELEQPKHGEIIGNNFYFGESVKFSCNRGYMMIGQETSTCEASGTWTNRSPRCIETRCFSIQRQKHGRVVGTGNQIGSVLAFQCTLGYALKGSSKLHCVQIKNLPAKWNMLIPKCQAIRCEPLQPPENGFISGRSFTFPNFVVYACKQGYRLSGESKRNCNASGKWKGLAPNCQRITCPPIQNPLNEELVGDDFSVNSTVQFVCKAGYAVRGSYTSTCLLQGMWSHDPPTCQNIKCATPPIPKFGKVFVSQTHVRSVARYSCSIGYRLVGVTHRQCTRTSQFTVEAMWSANSPKCIPVRCSTLHAPLNGKIVGDNFHYPHFVLYLCDYGYQILSGNSTRKCNELGKWTGIAPLCKGICEVARLNCSNAEICAADSDGSATCICKSRSDCPLDVRPVCGSDGRTYINECLMEVEACLFGSDTLRMISQGACVFLSCLPFKC
ncbi:sushi, von Willebrand factor type A, EGF and pentraxin domain-containing protein 1-like isoform X2 [Corticium candelabrum]|uniref:sushi, von Willebrand factor type A, EGF and pentraxin domain-containing protein 1-like isoform X2 n=1 Tax=Corticium candelabrum TaxID=121492 RepID=UPI002E271468|nr:sushi, von Willebrand factor type A, EGF and pentraxin domain-containing protein 1-like isoform X2 [Corticium candelabrum]